jgi:hypothetical protein
MTTQNAKIEEAQMSKSKRQLKSKCLNAKTTPFSHLSFGLCHLEFG